MATPRSAHPLSTTADGNKAGLAKGDSAVSSATYAIAWHNRKLTEVFGVHGQVSVP